MRQFFLDYFDAVSNEQYHNPRTSLRTYILTFPNDGARLELMQRPDTIDADPSKPDIGFIHVSFAVGSKEAVDSKTIELRDAVDGSACIVSCDDATNRWLRTVQILASLR